MVHIIDARRYFVILINMKTWLLRDMASLDLHFILVMVRVRTLITTLNQLPKFRYSWMFTFWSWVVSIVLKVLNLLILRLVMQATITMDLKWIWKTLSFIVIAWPIFWQVALIISRKLITCTHSKMLPFLILRILLLISYQRRVSLNINSWIFGVIIKLLVIPWYSTRFFPKTLVSAPTDHIGISCVHIIVQKGIHPSIRRLKTASRIHTIIILLRHQGRIKQLRHFLRRKALGSRIRWQHIWFKLEILVLIIHLILII